MTYSKTNIYLPPPLRPPWTTCTVAMEHQMGPQTSENILSQLNWDPRGTCLTLTTDDCLKDVNY